MTKQNTRRGGARAARKALLLPALALLLVALLPGAARAQWTAPDANQNISNTNSGSVGVGTTEPASKLDVKGSTADSSASSLRVRNTAEANLLFVRNDGFVGIKTASPESILHVADETVANNLVTFEKATDGTGFPSHRGARARGTLANKTIVASGDYLYRFAARGWDGGAYRNAAQIDFIVDNTPGASDMPGRIVFATTSDGGNFPAERMRIDSAGNVGIGAVSPTSRLHVLGGNVFHQWGTAAGQEYGFYTSINNNHFTSNLAFDGQWKMIAAGKGAMANVGPASGFAFSVYADNTSRAAGGLASFTQHFTVMMDGKVGVGNPSPAYLLDVAGQVRSSSGGFVFPDGTTQATAASGTVSGVTAGSGLTGGGSAGALTLNVGAGTGLTAAPDSISVNYGSAAGTAVQGNTTLTVAAGAGMSGGGTSTLGAGGTLTLTNSDRGSSQNIFKHVANAAGVTQFSANSNSDALRFEGIGGTTVSFDAGARKVTINSTATAASGWTDGGASLTTTNASASVGIGTSAPSRSLEVVRPVAGNFDGLFIYNSSGSPYSSSDTVSLSLGRSSGHVMGQITASNKQTGTFGDGYLAFSTRRAEVVSERVRIDEEGRVGIGTATPGAGLGDPTVKLDVQGSVHVSGSINAKYQDVAEWVPSVQKLSAGTVVVLDAGRTNHVLASSGAYDTKVAGVVSAQPGVILGVAGEGKVMVATTGRVKVKVDATRGAVKVGDLLVTSGVEGVAMRSVPVDLGGTQIHRPGTIIGKALETLESGVGEILVLLSLQ